MTDIVQRIYAAIHLESAEIAPRTSALIEAAREAAYVIGKLQNALVQIRRITEEGTILDELKNSRPMAAIAADKFERLQMRLDEAELALRVWDLGHESEYWRRHDPSVTADKEQR